MVTRADIENEAAFVQRLMKLQNPTGTAHTPLPWRKPVRADNGRIIESEIGVAVGYFQRAEDRDLALYFANVHPAIITMLRSLATSFAFIGAATADPSLRTYADHLAETTTIYTDIFCRLGKLEGPDLPFPPEVGEGGVQ
jgi:hypothetical protein